MFENKRKFFTIAALLAVMRALIFINPSEKNYDNELENAVKSISSEQVNINSVIPFEWDAIYSFPAYTDKNTIEKEIGIKSRKIMANDINEGMVHLIFVNDDEVLTTILGYSDNLGYDIVFGHKITYDEDAVFNVVKENNITRLEKI